MDLDRFKVINDSLGHNTGDRLLVEIANRLKFSLRSSDTAARIGGDEFVILLEDIKGVEDAVQVSDRIQEELRSPFHLGEHLVYVTASIGLVMSVSSASNASNYERPEEILRDADIAMYRAKALGKARCEVFDTNLRAQALARLELENDLRSGLAQGEFRLHYQPIQSRQTDRPVGFEALLRWQPPGRDPIAPAEFIPVAEETGLIIPLGEWVLHEACNQLRIWQDQYPFDPPLTMNVNISGKQFTHPGLAEQIEAILAETGVPPACLRLEITETVFMESAEFADSILNRLLELGINLQIDDFGTGYSSLSNLQRFPIHTIKIDRSFISRIGQNGEKAEIVRTIIALAHDLGMDAIAEGIETEDQYAQLKTLYCPFGQGYYIARPLDREAVGEMLAVLLGRQQD
jgi:diguanylate cyclase (GGDEF)-like protein